MKYSAEQRYDKPSKLNIIDNNVRYKKNASKSVKQRATNEMPGCMPAVARPM